jgi:hypothetical protein
MKTFPFTLGTFLRFFSISLLALLILFYVQFQARNLLQGPTITLKEAHQALQSERTLTLHGTARNIVKLTLNGREIHTNEQGDFVQPVVLENGYSIMTLLAQDRFGRTTVVTREYVYAPQS